MQNTALPCCAACKSKACTKGKDCFERADNHLEFYKDLRVAELQEATLSIEEKKQHHAPRLQEIICFAKELGCETIGLAFCVGLSEEAKIINKILSKHFRVVSVCCKIAGIEKREIAGDDLNENRKGISCNPAGQASVLNEAGTELNVVCGLCVGHDAIFGMLSKAPVTTLAVKDRVLAHNPLGAVYSRYVRGRIERYDSERQCSESSRVGSASETAVAAAVS